MTDPEGIDTTNRFAVGVSARDVVALKLALRLPPDDALNLAAWLVAMAEAVTTLNDQTSARERFNAILEAVLVS